MKGLEELDKLKPSTIQRFSIEERLNAYRIIEKELKALEIIKKVIIFKNGKWDIDLYRANEKERDLLKEVLKNE